MSQIFLNHPLIRKYRIHLVFFPLISLFFSDLREKFLGKSFGVIGDGGFCFNKKKIKEDQKIIVFRPYKRKECLISNFYYLFSISKVLALLKKWILIISFQNIELL